jgi:NADH-quinone oxidoreductase subunit L
LFVASFENFKDHCYLIPLFPLIGAVISGFLGALWLKGRSHWPIWIGVGLSALMSIGLLVATLNNVYAPGNHHLVGENARWFTWIQTGTFRAEAGAWIDPLTAVMLA